MRELHKRVSISLNRIFMHNIIYYKILITKFNIELRELTRRSKVSMIQVTSIIVSANLITQILPTEV